MFRELGFKTLIYIVLLGVFAPVSAFGQSQSGAIQGVVTNPAHQPIPGITVVLNHSTKGTATHIDGSYRIENLHSGSHTLTISGVGFEKQEHVISVASGETVILNVQLQEQSLQINELVILGKSEGEVIREKGFAVNTIETRGIELQSIEAIDLLDRSAGVRIRKEGGLGSRVKYNINGLSGNSVRIFINGIPMDNYGSSFSLSSIPTSLIERIEVYKGVVPAHLGNDALGGAINVITKTKAPNTFNASYSFGSFNTHQAGFNGNYRNPKTGLTFHGSVFYNYSDNNYKVWGNKVYVTNPETGKKTYIEAERFHDSYRSAGSKFDFGFSDVKWADQAFVGVVLSDMRKDIQHGVTMELVYGNRKAEQSTKLLNAVYKKGDFLMKGLDIDFFGSYSNLHRNVIDTIPYMYNWAGQRTRNAVTGEWNEWASGAEGNDPTLNEDHEKVWTGRVFLTYRFNEQNRLIFNSIISDFSRNPDDPMKPLAEREVRDTRTLVKNITGLAFENESFRGKLKSSLFFKFYRQDMAYYNIERRENQLVSLKSERDIAESGFGIALSYNLTTYLQLTGSAENSLRLPESHEIFGNTVENILPTVGLKPERSTNFNLGFILEPFQQQPHNLKLNTNFFVRDVTDNIRRGVPHPLNETVSFVNLDDVISTGFDAEVNYSYKNNFTWILNSSVSNMRFNTEFDADGARYDYYKVRLPNEPYFTVNNNIRYSISNLVQSGSLFSIYHNVSYVHEFFRNWENYGGANKDVIPSQLVNDLGFAYSFPDNKTTLSFDARNILNEQVFDNWALQKPGRAFFVKINYKIQ